jgi:hypothetical protein
VNRGVVSWLCKLTDFAVFKRVDGYIAEKYGGKGYDFIPVKIYVAGGAASVLEGSRLHTHDIDFWTENTKAMDYFQLVEDAVQSTVDKTDLKAGVPIMNSQIQVSADHKAFKENAIKRSKEQNVIYFRGSGLVVYAYDYGFQVVTKLDKMAGIPEREVDVMDAVKFLERYKQRHGTLSISGLKNLYPQQDGVPDITDRSIQRLIWAYEQKWQGHPAAHQVALDFS